MNATTKSDPGLFDYWPYDSRPKIEWPGGARVALWIAPNIEFYEYAPPDNPQRKPWPRPLPDIQSGDIVMHKRMASPFFETNLWSLLTFHKVDTLIVTGGSTSGCVRACVIDSLSRGYRTLVPEECVADKHEIPHFANLCDIMLKYGDVEPVAHVAAQLEALRR